MLHCDRYAHGGGSLISLKRNPFLMIEWQRASHRFAGAAIYGLIENFHFTYRQAFSTFMVKCPSKSFLAFQNIRSSLPLSEPSKGVCRCIFLPVLPEVALQCYPCSVGSGSDRKILFPSHHFLHSPLINPPEISFSPTLSLCRSLFSGSGSKEAQARS